MSNTAATSIPSAVFPCLLLASSAHITQRQILKRFGGKPSHGDCPETWSSPGTEKWRREDRLITGHSWEARHSGAAVSEVRRGRLS